MEDEDLFPYIKRERPVMPPLETLKDWLHAMCSGNGDGRINAKTGMNMNRILNDETFNGVVFDNAGGMMFAIWEFDSPEKVEDFIAYDGFREDLIFGYIKDGVQTLCEYQKEYPNWNIKPISK